MPANRLNHQLINMKNANLLAVLAMALILTGAGCSSTQTSETENTEENATTPTEETTASVTGEATEGTSNQLVTSVTIDDTWQAYTNKSLGFRFNWPTKGRYAPNWDVSFLKSDDANIADGCYGNDNTRRVSVGEVSFCRTGAVTDEDKLATDRYVTKHGETYVVMTFNKEKTTAEGFDWNEYHAFLDQIVSTFKLGE